MSDASPKGRSLWAEARRRLLRNRAALASLVVLALVALLCVLGLRYPLRMLPVLLWEVLWKTLWLILVPLPQWLAGRIDESIKPSIFACSMVVLVYLAIPWRYVFTHYAKAGGDRWR